MMIVNEYIDDYLKHPISSKKLEGPVDIDKN